MENVIYQIINALNSDQEVLIVQEYDNGENAIAFDGIASDVPMMLFSICDCQNPELIRIETHENLLTIVFG